MTTTMTPHPSITTGAVYPVSHSIGPLILRAGIAVAVAAASVSARAVAASTAALRWPSQWLAAPPPSVVARQFVLSRKWQETSRRGVFCGLTKGRLDGRHERYPFPDAGPGHLRIPAPKPPVQSP